MHFHLHLNNLETCQTVTSTSFSLFTSFTLVIGEALKTTAIGLDISSGYGALMAACTCPNKGEYNGYQGGIRYEGYSTETKTKQRTKEQKIR
jgi:hypothetical protein